ncbi:MAG: VWA domain-containing protein [Bacteroidales bacterium]|nr:VWA domain-containing protein [Bacteroidales bacterium]
MSFFNFHHSELLWGLLIIPLLIIIYFVVNYFAHKKLLKFGNLNLVKTLMPDRSKFRPVIKFVLLIFAIGFMIFTLADKPEIRDDNTDKNGVEIIIALDISNSMMANDIPAGRLEAAKMTINKLVDRLDKENNIGLIVFAGEAFVQLPITQNFVTAKMFLKSISPELISTQGTAIGEAINLATRSFTPKNENNKVLIIITDGEDHQQDAIEMAKLAAEKEIIVHTIGMGLPKGGPIPVIINGKKDYKRNSNNEIVVTKLNQKMLVDIANAGKGKYFTYSSINGLFEEIAKLDKTNLAENMEEEADIIIESSDEKFYFQERFLWFAGIALFFLLLEFVIIERKNRLFKNFNIFKLKI